MAAIKFLLVSATACGLIACNPAGPQQNHTGGYDQRPGVAVRDPLPGVAASSAPDQGVGFSDHLNGSNLRSTGMTVPNGISGAQNQMRENNTTQGHVSNPDS